MAQTRIDTYQIEPGTNGQVLTVSGGVAVWATDANGLASSAFVNGEVPSGAINDANTSYTLANTPFLASEALFLDGLRLTEGGGNDYTISGSTVTMLYAPLTGQNFLVDYRK